MGRSHRKNRVIIIREMCHGMQPTDFGYLPSIERQIQIEEMLQSQSRDNYLLSMSSWMNAASHVNASLDSPHYLLRILMISFCE
eukprot:scaffold6626_cov106-Skeletonema_marinoi.AAC.2